jgi:Peptidase family M28
MRKDYSSILETAFIFGILALLFVTMMPIQTFNESEALSEFSTKRAFAQVEAIAQKPHFVGSKNHETVANYLQSELQKLGLETSLQEGFTMLEGGYLVNSKNILARIKGSDSKKALLLLSHYDSAPHSYSLGASDDGAGLATILEGVRAFLYSKKTHKNDIIILFSDAEELGLNGAALFVTQHKWAKEVGLVLNFEARGSSGPSYMLMETNKGNAGLVQEFAKAKTKHPVSNSLMYSIYKLLPNDTDLTVFREKGDIQGFNFAFIDSHFNYHTAQDIPANLDKKTLAHQGTYLMPLLNYFSNANLEVTKNTQDDVYFTVPFAFVHYPFDWVLPMTIIAGVLLLLLIFFGLAKKVLSFSEMAKGFLPLLGSLLFAGAITFFGWQILLQIYPQYNDLLNGFTYNGHDYILAFVLFSVAICFVFYGFFTTKKTTMNHYIAPLFLWIIINAGIANSLQGAGFLIIPVLCGLFLLAVFVITQKTFKFLNLLFGIPTLFIITPFIETLPVGLGLKILFASAILVVLSFGLLLPTFGAFAKKGVWAFLFFLASIGFFAKANYESGYDANHKKSNSLVYFYNGDTNKASWVTYDTNLDSWTKNVLGEKPKTAIEENKIALSSKYKTVFTFSVEAPIKAIKKPTIEFLKDTIVNKKRFLKIKITPNRNVNLYDIYANEKLTVNNLKANGVQSLDDPKVTPIDSSKNRIIRYYVVNNTPLEFEFSMDAKAVLDMNLMESSFDLLSNPAFEIQKRESWMMPTPFILNDAVVIVQKLKPSPKKVVEALHTKIANPVQKDSLGN